MNPNNNPSRQHRPNRWARLKKQLKQARAEIAELKEKFEIEKNAKNRAYSFILTTGGIKDYLEYSRATLCTDAMAICLGELLEQISQKQG